MLNLEEKIDARLLFFSDFRLLLLSLGFPNAEDEGRRRKGIVEEGFGGLGTRSNKAEKDKEGTKEGRKKENMDSHPQPTVTYEPKIKGFTFQKYKPKMKIEFFFSFFILIILNGQTPAMRPQLCGDGLVISSGKIVLVNVFTAVGGVVNLRCSPCGSGTRVGFGHMAGEISWLFIYN